MVRYSENCPSMRPCFPYSLAVVLFTLPLFVPHAAQAQVIPLDTVIGVPGANAATVAGAGNAVNFTSFGSNSGATTLTATGSTGSSSFDFNTGFSDSLDRATGSTAGAPNVWADLKYDSATTAPLILDTNSDGSFADETAQSGFGMHGDTFITFDLDVIRANAGLAAGTSLLLTGAAGIANTTLAPTSGAIIGDSTQLAVFDWNSPTSTYSPFSLSLSGSTRYLTFIGLSGLDGDNFFAHVGFINVQLAAIPEPFTVSLLALGLGLGGWSALRRRKR